MNARVSLTAQRVKWFAPLLALVVLAAVASAAELLRVPEDTPLTFYALGLGHSGWTRRTGSLPLSAIRQIPSRPTTTCSTSRSTLPGCPISRGTWRGSRSSTKVLTRSRLSSRTVPGVKVPIWFTSVSAWNDKWTVAEMEKQGSLRDRRMSFRTSAAY